MIRSGKNKMRIEVSKFIGKPICISASDAQKLYNFLAKAIKNNEHIELSFRGIDIIVSSFLNVSIGQLYGKYDDLKIAEHIKPVDIDSANKGLLDRVIDNAKKYYEHAETYDIAWSKI